MAALARAAVSQVLAAAARAQRPRVSALATASRQQRQLASSSAAAAAGGRQPGGAPPPPPPPPVGAGAGAGPLSAAHSREMADKLTATAKNIVWVDHESSRPAEATRAQVADLQARLGYQFGNLWLLRLALVHSSAAPTTHNGILAWVGDAALYLILSEEVGGRLGYVPIGQLSEVRKALIGRAMCEQYAAKLGLAQHLVVGKSYRTQHGAASSNMVAEMFEAVMGAIYLDGGLEAVRAVYLSHFPLPPNPLSLLQAEAADSPWDSA